MKVSVLTSSSKGNATYLECGDARLLIDCGVSAKQIENHLIHIGVRPETIDAILITHEHRDHIAGVSVFSRKYSVPVYANAGAAQFLENIYRLVKFETGKTFKVKNAKISSFTITHDAHDPVGFVATEPTGLKYGHVTDIGRVTTLLKSSLQGCNALVFESNHDDEMLATCDYPWELKQRIRSSHGHISNMDAARFLSEIMHDNLNQIILAHISENSNTPELALSTATSYFEEVGLYCENICCANVGKPTTLFEIGFNEQYEVAVGQ